MNTISEFQQMLDMAPCGMGLFHLDGNGRYSYLNNTFYQLIGYSRDEYEKFSCNSCEKLIYPEDICLLPEQVRRVFSEGKAEAEYRIIRKNGDIIWIKFNASRIVIEGSEMVFATFTDITTQKNLLSQMELVAGQVGSSVSVIRIVNNKPYPVFTNDEFYRMIGVSREEYIKDPQKSDEIAVSREDRFRISAAVEKAFSTGEPVDVKYWLKRPDKTSIYVLRKATVLQKTAEEGFLLLSVVLDMTAQKKADDRRAFGQERYRLVLDRVNATIMDWNYQTGEFYSSVSYKKYAISCIDPQTILNNKGPSDMVHPDDVGELKKFFSSKGGAKQKSECVVRLKMLDGSFRWSRIIGFTSYDADKKPIRSIGAIMDINDDLEKTFIMNELISALPGGVGVFKCGQKMECVYFNKTFEPFSNCSKAEIQKLFNTPGFVQKTVLPSDWQEFETEVLSKIKKGAPVNCNFRYYKKGNGNENTIGWLHLSATKIREQNGEQVYYAIFMPQPDENKLFKQMSENSLVAELVVDVAGCFVLSANKAMKMIAGFYNNENLVGHSIDDIFTLSDAEKLRLQLLQLSSDKYSEAMLTTEDGRMLLVRGQIIDWNGTPAAILYFLDQTNIQQQKEHLEALLNNVPIGIGVFEVVGENASILYLNNGFYKMLDYSGDRRKKFSGSSLFNAVYKEDRNFVMDAIRLIASENICPDITFRLLNGHKKYIWLRLLGYVCKKNDGKSLVYCSFLM